MDPDRDLDYADYLLADRQRDTLLNNPSLVMKDTNKADNIRDRARNLDNRIQYLLEDIELLHRTNVLEEVGVQNFKVSFEEVDPFIESRIDSSILKHEMKHPDGVNVSSFGVALGHMLSQIYPGDRTEQTRLWWGLALGYFGHPSRKVPQPYINSKSIFVQSSADVSNGPPPRVFQTLSEVANIPDEPPQSVLSTIYRKFTEQEESNLSSKPQARYRAKLTLKRFGHLLYEELADDGVIEDVTDFSLAVQAVIVATMWGGLNCRKAHRHLLRLPCQS